VRRPLLISLIGLTVFIAIVLARLPVQWLIPKNAPFSCATLEGTLWSGTCGGLNAVGQPLGELSWELHPLALLRARLGAQLTLVHPAGRASAEAEFGPGGLVQARNLRADFTLDPRLMPALPGQLHGSAHADLELLALKDGALRELKGTLEARNLEERSGDLTPLGSFAVRFPGGPGEPVGQVHDLGGPLSLEGTLRLPRGGYELEALVAARPEAPPALQNNLRILGTPDERGRRQLTVSGEF
jgi:general secretion pathway protein N